MNRSLGVQIATLASVLLLATSCDTKSSERENHSEIISAQKGRMALLPASNGYPPLIVDTVSGCVIAVRSELPLQSVKGSGAFDDLIPASAFYLQEISFQSGTNPCRVMRQVPVVDTLEESE